MKVGACQLIYVGLMLMSLGIHLAKHGEPRHDSYNFFTAFLSAALQITLVALGGFFG